MKKINILVTAVGGDLGQSVIKCLRDTQYAAHITGCDMNPYAAGRAEVDDFLQAPPVSAAQEYENYLQQTILAKKIDYVFPLSDVEILYLNSRREMLAETPAQFMMNEPHIIETFMDKYKTVDNFKANGIPYPETYLQEEYDNQLGYPLILKRRRGSGSQKLFIVKEQEELEFYLKRNDDMILQEYIPGDENEYTTGIFSDGENTQTITFRRTLAPGGFSQQVEPVDNENIAGFLKKLTAALEFKGSLNVQFRLNGNRCVPFEINPRFSSTVYFRHYFGFKDVIWTLQMSEGKKITYTPSQKKQIGVRKFNEVFFDTKE
ncbi:MAG: ATP-grasp domain-containing protein [bacterium]|nr:ATP-grasp domain-containing protein [bacterium]